MIKTRKNQLHNLLILKGRRKYLRRFLNSVIYNDVDEVLDSIKGEFKTTP
jgi:hypothetical protein